VSLVRLAVLLVQALARGLLVLGPLARVLLARVLRGL